MTDLEAHRVRFIADAADRIQEDYLRILRFFRFHAYYGDPDQGMDVEALSAIAANLDGLADLSQERVTAELLKLLTAPDPAPAVAAMDRTGALGRVLPGADPRALAPLVHLEDGYLPDPIRRLAALGGEVEDHLRLSNAETRRLGVLRSQTGSNTGISELGYRHGAATAMDVALLRAALMGQSLPNDADVQAKLGAQAVMPVRAADLMPRLQGSELGAALARIEAAWIASKFTLTRDELLD